MRFDRDEGFWENPDNIEKFSRLWAEGISQTEIGNRMGISKHAVNGKRRRLGLPGRASPIIRVRKIKVFKIDICKPDEQRRALGHEPLPAFHPIAVHVLRAAGLPIWT